MTQPPQDGPGPRSGHPEPEPVPEPEPEPPQPIPPPEPVPLPEPPHSTPPPPVHEPAVARASPEDFLDGDPPVPPVEWPPVGAYPGEPGHSDPAPPTELIPAPWHAQHERPGEWRTRPPEHLAWQHSPPAVAGPEPPEPIWAGSPWEVPLAPAPPKRRGGLWVSLALTVILLLCGGGAVSAYFLISNADTGNGAPDPATAVNRFMTAVYTQQDPGVANNLVCRQARDTRKLTAKIKQIKSYSDEYAGPRFRWSDPVAHGETRDRAVVSITLIFSTDDEKQAEQPLSFTMIRKANWLVCDVTG